MKDWSTGEPFGTFELRPTGLQQYPQIENDCQFRMSLMAASDCGARPVRDRRKGNLTVFTRDFGKFPHESGALRAFSY
jgi:hypothetical protein